MIRIPMITVDGTLTPQSPPEAIPNAVAIIMNSNECLVYQKGDSIPATGPSPLSLAINDAVKAITARRKQAEYSGFTLNGLRWDSEEKDELRLNSMITMMEKFSLAQFEGWKINADTFITLTPDLAMQAAASMMQHYNTCFQVEAAKKTALASAALQTTEEVQDWLTATLNEGWPGQ